MLTLSNTLKMLAGLGLSLMISANAMAQQDFKTGAYSYTAGADTTIKGKSYEKQGNIKRDSLLNLAHKLNSNTYAYYSSSPTLKNHGNYIAVKINGKDSIVKVPFNTATYSVSVPGYVAVPYPNPDKIPTLKPDMSKYRMPNMIKPALKKPATIQLQDTVGKK